MSRKWVVLFLLVIALLIVFYFMFIWSSEVTYTPDRQADDLSTNEPPPDATTDEVEAQIAEENTNFTPQKEQLLPEEAVPPATTEAMVEGRVYHIRGVPAGQVKVWRRDHDKESVTTDDAGRFEAPAIWLKRRLHVAPPFVMTHYGKAVGREALLLVVSEGIDISGTVMDGNGRPLPEVAIEIAKNPLPDFPELLDRTKNIRYDSIATDDRGNFALNALPAGGVTLEFTKAGYEPLPVEVTRNSSGYRSYTLNKIRDGVHKITGMVTDHLSNPVPNALVGLGENETRTSTVGEYSISFNEEEIPRKGLNLYAAKPGYRPHVIPGFGTHSEDLKDHEIDLQLPGLALEISGRFLDARDKGIPRVTFLLAEAERVTKTRTVEDLAADESVDPHPDLLAAGRAYGITDDDGAFIIRGLLDKEYLLRAFEKNLGYAFTTDPIRAGSKDLIIHLPVNAFRPSFSGKVMDRFGDPVPDAPVRASMLVARIGSSNVYNSGIKSTRTKEDGTFSFELFCRSDNVYLSVSGEDILHNSHVVTPDDPDSGFELVIERRCRFKVELSDPSPAHSFKLLDDEGEELMISYHEETRSSHSNIFEIHDGKSVVVGASDRASTLVLIGDDDKETKVPVRLVPGEITVIRH